MNEEINIGPLRRAQKVLEDLQIDTAVKIDPFLIAEKLTGKSVFLENVQGFNGMLITVEDRNAILINNSIREEGKKRFTCAHEIGHFLLHGDKKERIRCTEEDIDVIYKKKYIESEANEFASELLIPTEILKKLINGKDPSKALLNTLMDRFGTTLTATVLKYIKLCDLICAVVVTKNEIVNWCYKSEYFENYIPIGHPVPEGTCARNFFSNKNVPADFYEVSAEKWIEGKNVTTHSKILELSIPQPLYNQVLTILWLEEDLQQLEEYSEDYTDEFDGYLKKRWDD